MKYKNIFFNTSKRLNNYFYNKFEKQIYYIITPKMFLHNLFYTGVLYSLTKLTNNFKDGKKIVSLIHATFIFSYVFWIIYYSLQTNEIMIRTVLCSFSYLVIDSFVCPIKRQPSIYFHHLLVSIGELYSLYSETYPIAFYSYLGESFSIFLHLRSLCEGSKLITIIAETGVVISCFLGRIVLSIYCWFWVFNIRDNIALGLYTAYTLLNFYWGGVMVKKLREKYIH